MTVEYGYGPQDQGSVQFAKPATLWRDGVGHALTGKLLKLQASSTSLPRVRPRA